MTGLEKRDTITMKRWQWGLLTMLLGIFLTLIMPKAVDIAFSQGGESRAIADLTRIVEVGFREVKSELIGLRSEVSNMGRELARVEARQEGMAERHSELRDSVEVLKLQIRNLEKQQAAIGAEP